MTSDPKKIVQASSKKIKMPINQLGAPRYENSPNYIAIKKHLASKVNALKNIHLKITSLEEKFYEELHQLECKYAKLYEPLFEQREKVITGEHEPTPEEATWNVYVESDEAKNDSGNENDVKDLIKDLESKIDISEDASFKVDDLIGVPHFWIQVFKRTDLIMDMVQEHDEDILIYLYNIKVVMNDTKPYGYTLEFYFHENKYFTNKVLTKTYELTCAKDESDPFSYDGPVMYKCKGCTIDWNKDMDVTVRTIKKRQKHKSTGTVRVILKEEKTDSFFNYFASPTADGIRPSFRSLLQEDTIEIDEEDDEIGEDLCNADFEIGHFFKEYIVPKAVLYYTGDLIDQASYTDENAPEFYPDSEESDDIGDEDMESLGDEEIAENNLDDSNIKVES